MAGRSSAAQGPLRSTGVVQAARLVNRATSLPGPSFAPSVTQGCVAQGCVVTTQPCASSTGLRSTGSFARPWNPAHISPSSGRGPQRRCDSASGSASGSWLPAPSAGGSAKVRARPSTSNAPNVRCAALSLVGRCGLKKKGNHLRGERGLEPGLYVFFIRAERGLLHHRHRRPGPAAPPPRRATAPH